MAFTWTYESKIGDNAKVNALSEMQDNCDWLLDNQACVTEDSAINTTYYTVDDNAEDITIVPTGFITIYTTIQTGECSSNLSGNNVPFQTNCGTANNNVYNVLYQSMHYSGLGGCTFVGS